MYHHIHITSMSNINSGIILVLKPNKIAIQACFFMIAKPMSAFNLHSKISIDHSLATCSIKIQTVKEIAKRSEGDERCLRLQSMCPQFIGKENWLHLKV